MNTTGWVRGYISNNSPNDKFVSFVINTIGKEFRLNTAIQLINDTYVIKVGQYETRLVLMKLNHYRKPGHMLSIKEY